MKQPKHDLMQVYAPRKYITIIDEACEIQGVSRSTFLRLLGLKEAKIIIKENTGGSQ